MIWLWTSAILMAITAVIHSVAGEKRLIMPALAIGKGVLAVPFARKVLRGAWHLTSLFMLLTAAVMVWPRTDAGLKGFVAAAWLVMGLYSLMSSRGKHIGWPTLTLAGVAGLLGSMI